MSDGLSASAAIGASEAIPLEVTSVSRSFGPTRALDEAELVVKQGEIHGLAGENGSGKSTLIKILSGVIQPDAGEIRWLGDTVRFRRPGTAQAAGICTVHQETLVVLEQTVQENILIGTDGIFRHGSTSSEGTRKARDIADALGLEDVDLGRPLWTLSLAERQIVTLARALVRPWRLLLVDEGTSALDSNQRDKLFDYLRAEREQGKSILFTTHRMDELRQLADTVSVLRLGRTVASLSVGETSARQILEHMAGKGAVELGGGAAATGAAARRGRRDSADTQTRKEVLRISDLSLRPNRPGTSLTLTSGEILGVAGLEGQGQVDFALSIAGLRRPATGSLSILDERGSWHSIHGFGDAMQNGVAYVPRDRKQEGLFFSLSIQDNFGIVLLRDLHRFGVLRRRSLLKQYTSYADLLHVRYGRSRDSIATLSGGNQQKILLARWLATQPTVLVLNDPLRGVDANTKQELYGLLRDLADRGMAIVFVSTEILEFLALADRIAVFHDSALQTILPAAAATETEIIAAMFGHPDEEGQGE